MAYIDVWRLGMLRGAQGGQESITGDNRRIRIDWMDDEESA